MVAPPAFVPKVLPRPGTSSRHPEVSDDDQTPWDQDSCQPAPRRLLRDFQAVSRQLPGSFRAASAQLPGSSSAGSRAEPSAPELQLCSSTSSSLQRHSSHSCGGAKPHRSGWSGPHLHFCSSCDWWCVCPAVWPTAGLHAIVIRTLQLVVLWCRYPPAVVDNFIYHFSSRVRAGSYLYAYHGALSRRSINT